MAFVEQLRLEKVYFKNLLTMIGTLRSWKDNPENKGEISDVLDSCIQANVAILQLYRNIGEEWTELSALIEKVGKELEALKDDVINYEGEINEKVDGVNNYLNALIQELEAQIREMKENRFSQDFGFIYNSEMGLQVSEYVPLCLMWINYFCAEVSMRLAVTIPYGLTVPNGAHLCTVKADSDFGKILAGYGMERENFFVQGVNWENRSQNVDDYSLQFRKNQDGSYGIYYTGGSIQGGGQKNFGIHFTFMLGRED